MKRTLVVLAVVATAAPANAAAVRDRRPPVVRVTTPEGAVRAGAPRDHELTTVAGTATDDRSGVASAEVTYCTGWKLAGGGHLCDGQRIETLTAALGPRGTWTARVPLVPGRYLAFARATDRAGNTGGADPVTVVVA